MATNSWAKYRGQWGGKIESGEEMWWSEPNPKIGRSHWARLLFNLDVRQHFILRFWRDCSSHLPAGTSPTLVDFGCGSGGTTLNFARVIGRPILGVDIFETQLQIARDFARDQGSPCRFEKIDESGKIPLGDSQADAVMSLDVLGHVPDISATLREFARVLKPGGSVLLFTEASYSSKDESLMARLAKQGADMVMAVPEHISLIPREDLEREFAVAGLQMLERFSANVGHFFFFPKDYVTLLKDRPDFRGWYTAARMWNRISKITPFYPWPFQILRLAATYLFGGRGYGTAYFYHLKKTG